MNPKYFFILSVFLVLALLTPYCVTAETELEWIDSGKVVYPGVHLTVQVHSEASRTLGGLANAGIVINKLVFGFDEGGTWYDPHVILVMGGHQHDLGSIPLWKSNYDVVLEFTIYCNGTMIVRAVNYGYEHEYWIPQEEVPIYYFEESNPALKGEVVIGRVEEILDCGDYEGPLPDPGESPDGGDWLDDLKGLLMYVGAGLIVLIGVLVVLNIFSTFRRW